MTGQQQRAGVCWDREPDRGENGVVNRHQSDGVAGEAPGPILIIEDNPDVQDLIATVLRQEGLQVEIAETGEEGVAMARQGRPALVVLDIGLPRMDGESVARELHAVHDGVPILVVTADGHAAEHARNVRAFGYLSKPFDLDHLVEAVRQGLRRGRAIEDRMDETETQ